MRLLRLDGGSSGPTVDLHPFFTVIRGLGGPARQEVLAALRALPTGSDPGMRGLLEAHGVLLDLDVDTLRLLDLHSQLDPVVRHTDLLEGGPPPPAAGPTPAPLPARGGTDPAEARRMAEEAQETYTALRDGLERLHDQRQRVSDEVAKAAASLESARSELDPFAAGALDQAVQELTAHEQQSVVQSGLSGSTTTAQAGTAEDVTRLTTRRQELTRALEALAGIDVQSVVDALTAVRAAEGVHLVPDPEAVALADAIAGAQRALAQYDAGVEAQGFGPEGAQRRVEELRLHVARLEQAARPKVAAPADVEALEQAHEAVVEAEERARGRLAGKGALRKLEELQAAEQAILDRLGFASYTSFSFSASAPEVDVEARVALQDARVQLAQAEHAVGEMQQMVQHDARRMELVAHLEALRGQALPLVGGEDGGDLEGALRNRRIQPAAPVDVMVTPEQAAARLRATLEHHGVAFGDRPLGADEVAQVAAVWLTEMEDSTRTNRTRLEQELAQVDDALAHAQVAPAPAPVVEAVPVPDDPALAPLRQAVRSAEARLARHRSVVARVASLHAELEAASEKERELLEQVEAHANVLDQAADSARAAVQAAQLAQEQAVAVPTPALVPVEVRDGELMPPDQLEWYLLARLSANRGVSFAGSVPLVLDEALLGLPTDQVRSLLDHLERMSESVQIVYLSDDRDVLDWVASAGRERAAAVAAA
jgi:hypothetical protein